MHESTFLESKTKIRGIQKTLKRIQQELDKHILSIIIKSFATFGTIFLSHTGIGRAVDSSSHPHSLNLHEQRFI